MCKTRRRGRGAAYEKTGGGREGSAYRPVGREVVMCGGGAWVGGGKGRITVCGVRVTKQRIEDTNGPSVFRRHRHYRGLGHSDTAITVPPFPVACSTIPF